MGREEGRGEEEFVEMIWERCGWRREGKGGKELVERT